MVHSVDKNLAKQVVFTVNEVCDRPVNFISPDGIILASTDESRVDSFHEIGKIVADNRKAIEVTTDSDYAGTKKGINMPIFYNNMLVAVVGISGEPTEIRKYAHLAERITNLFIREREFRQHNRIQSEKTHYIIQSLTGDAPYNQDYLRLCLDDTDFNLRTPKRVVVVRINERYNLQNLSLIEARIKEMSKKITPSIYTYNYPYEYYAIVDDEAMPHAEKVLRHFSAEHAMLLKIGIGKSTEIFELKKSYESALTALNSIKDTDECFVIYDQLVIDLVISDVKKENADSYVEKTISELTTDDCEFLKIYFDENLSLSRTSEKTYLHKNTIQYRLNRIADQTGYNPRVFTDAVALYLALLMDGKNGKD